MLLNVTHPLNIWTLALYTGTVDGDDRLALARSTSSPVGLVYGITLRKLWSGLINEPNEPTPDDTDILTLVKADGTVMNITWAQLLDRATPPIPPAQMGPQLLSLMQRRIGIGHGRNVS